MDKQTDYDAMAGEVLKYDKLLKEATIGYYKAKIWGEEQLQAVWGQINDRKIKMVRKIFSNQVTYNVF